MSILYGNDINLYGINLVIAPISLFVQHKSAQLSFFVRGFWSQQIPYTEIDLFFWDTMEEWADVNNGQQVPYTKTERVFWHVLHQMHYWSKNSLQYDPKLRRELEHCLVYLESDGLNIAPLDCIGIRP